VLHHVRGPGDLAVDLHGRGSLELLHRVPGIGLREHAARLASVPRQDVRLDDALAAPSSQRVANLRERRISREMVGYRNVELVCQMSQESQLADLEPLRLLRCHTNTASSRTLSILWNGIWK